MAAKPSMWSKWLWVMSTDLTLVPWVSAMTLSTSRGASTTRLSPVARQTMT